MKMENLFRALSDPTRQKIIINLDKKPHCVSEMVEKIHLSQPTISKHLNVLRNAGIVSSKRKKQKVFYSLERGYLKRELKEFLKNLGG